MLLVTIETPHTSWRSLHASSWVPSPSIPSTPRLLDATTDSCLFPRRTLIYAFDKQGQRRLLPIKRERHRTSSSGQRVNDEAVGARRASSCGFRASPPLMLETLATMLLVLVVVVVVGRHAGKSPAKGKEGYRSLLPLLRLLIRHALSHAFFVRTSKSADCVRRKEKRKIAASTRTPLRQAGCLWTCFLDERRVPLSWMREV